MPTILRFRNFRVVIYYKDHTPPHVHALGSGGEIIFNLNCPQGPPSTRASYKVSAAQTKALTAFLSDHLANYLLLWRGSRGSEPFSLRENGVDA